MATHSSVLAWGISGTGEPGGLPSLVSHRVASLLKQLSSTYCLERRLSSAIKSCLGEAIDVLTSHCFQSHTKQLSAEEWWW